VLYRNGALEDNCAAMVRAILAAAGPVS
jgi:hypothetical protein